MKFNLEDARKWSKMKISVKLKAVRFSPFNFDVSASAILPYLLQGCHTNSKSKFQEIPGNFDNFFQKKLQQNILKSEWLPLKLCKLDSFSKKFSAPLNIILTTFTLESTLTGLFSAQIQSVMYTENNNN